MKYREHIPTPKQNVLLYGPPKSSKTTAACSAPTPLLLNCDVGNAAWFARTKHPNVKEIEYEGFKTMKEIGQALLEEKIPGETIVIDPIAELYRRLLEELSQRAVAPSLPTYLATQVHIERFCRALCESPLVNAVIVCHAMAVTNGDETEWLPATGTTNPALGMKLMGMVDVVAFTGVVEKENDAPGYVAQLINARGRRGGDRSGSLGSSRPLDLGEWFQTMTAAMAVDNSADAAQKE